MRMKNPTTCNPGALSRPFRVMIKAVLLPALIFSLTIPSLHAGSATWNLNPASGDWNTAANWTPATVPNGSSDTATFAVSDTTDVSLSADIEVNSIVFNAGASSFALSTGVGPILTISGDGVVNNSGVTQEIIVAVDTAGNEGSIMFHNSATAGSDILYTVSGSFTGYLGGYINFWDDTSAGDATFMLGGGVSGVSAAGGRIGFLGNSTAENGTIICQGGGPGSGTQAVADFYDSSSAGNATIVAKGSSFSDGVGGSAFFSFSSSADNAILVATGTESGFGAGSIYFASDATGDRARVEIFGTGHLDITLSSLVGVTIGSLEGSGDVFLGTKNLLVGSNNLSTTFRGAISGSGSLTKLGGGRLALSTGNIYTGGTHIQRGTLLVNNTSGSATGTGNVVVEGGVLAGTGFISGAVIVGTGSGHNPVLRPGQAQTTIGTALSISKSLTINSDAKCHFVINSDIGVAGAVIAKGVTINSALFSISDLGNSTLPPGATYTLISNTAATAIAGTFANLPNGSTLVLGTNTFQASYEGGSGHDLTLTVVP